MSRNFTPKNYPSLVAVVHQCITRAPSGLTTHDIAELLYPESTSAYNTMMAELTVPDRKFDADRLLAVLDVTGSDAPMHFLARQMGGVFLRIPIPASSGSELARALADSAKEYAEFMQATAASIADGDIPRDQLAAITKEGHEAIEAIYAMMSMARATHEKQYGGKS